MGQPSVNPRLPVLAATSNPEEVRQLLAPAQGEIEIFEVQFVGSLSEAAQVLQADRRFLVLWLDGDAIDTPEVLRELELPVLLCAADAHTRRNQLAEQFPPRHSLWSVAKQTDPAQTQQLVLSLCQQQRLRDNSLHDSLTGLANRALLLDRTNSCLMRAKRNPDYLFAMLFLDLERFKLINDSLGHEVADQLLVEISRRILTIVRSMDTVARVESDNLARLGGDEFVLLLDPIRRPEDAGRVAERLLKAISEPFRIGAMEVIASLRIGIAFGDASTSRAETMLRDAEAALHYAKRDHKQRYRLYNPEMHASAVKRLSMEVELRQAIEREQLCLHYQPIHSLSTGKIAEFEALVRWEHPERGRISPGDFIPLAEETGLIVPLGRWVLHAACKQMMRWAPQAAGMDRVGVGVNVSGRQFARPELLDDIREVLRETGLPPGRLCLEITESAIMENGAPMLEALQAISGMGIRLHLDDFGTGYSSMGYLNQMPIDVLKIDRSFVTKISGSTTGRPIVQAIIALARSLHMEVIAEGVDSEPIMSILTGMGCDCVQGYYLSAPLAADKALDYWRRFMNSLQLPMSNKVYISEAS
jgi:diguanylate cyclase (GGDEF)-like protein